MSLSRSITYKNKNFDIFVTIFPLLYNSVGHQKKKIKKKNPNYRYITSNEVELKKQQNTIIGGYGKSFVWMCSMMREY